MNPINKDCSYVIYGVLNGVKFKTSSEINSFNKFVHAEISSFMKNLILQGN